MFQLVQLTMVLVLRKKIVLVKKYHPYQEGKTHHKIFVPEKIEQSLHFKQKEFSFKDIRLFWTVQGGLLTC